MTGKAAIALTIVLLALFAGCGGDDEEEPGGSPPAQTATTEPQATATTEPEAGGAPDKAGLEACLTEAQLELKPGSEPFTDAEGKTKTRQALDVEGAGTYLGYVQWPSKSVADIYLSENEADAQKVEQEAGVFVEAFGLDSAKYVKRAGTVVMTFDDPPPSDEEAKAVEDCAAGS